MSAPRSRKDNVLGAKEQAFLERLQKAFLGSAWVDNDTPESAFEIDHRPLSLILHPLQLEEELATWGELSYRCPCCGERFVAASLFDAHRVSVPERPAGRRCLDTEELSRGDLIRGRRGIWGPRSADGDTGTAAAESTRTPSRSHIKAETSNNEREAS